MHIIQNGFGLSLTRVINGIVKFKMRIKLNLSKKLNNIRQTTNTKFE